VQTTLTALPWAQLGLGAVSAYLVVAAPHLSTYLHARRVAHHGWSRRSLKQRQVSSRFILQPSWVRVSRRRRIAVWWALSLWEA